MTNPIVLFVSALVSSLPFLVIAVVGVVLTRTRLSHAHSKARRLATIGFILLGLQSLVGTTIRFYVTSVAVSSGDRLAATSTLTAVGFVSFLLHGASLILLLSAVLADRGPRESSSGAI